MTTLQLDAFLPYRLSIASNRVSGVIATAYQALFGLKIPEWRLVCVLTEGGGLSQQALGVAHCPLCRLGSAFVLVSHALGG